MLILWLIRILALLLAGLVMTIHVFAFTTAEAVPRVFDGELSGVSINRVLAGSIAISLTALQIVLPIDLADRSLTYRIAASFLTTMIAVGGWYISASIFYTGMPPASFGLAAGIWLGTEIAATVLQALAWCRRSPRPQPASRQPERAAEPALSPPPAWGPFEQRLLSYLVDVAATDGVGSELVTTQAALAAKLGCSKSTINAALHALAAGGVIHLETTARQTRVRTFGRQVRQRSLPTAGDPTSMSASLPIRPSLAVTDVPLSAPVDVSDVHDGKTAGCSPHIKRASFWSERTIKAADLRDSKGVDRRIVRLVAIARTMSRPVAHRGNDRSRTSDRAVDGAPQYIPIGAS